MADGPVNLLLQQLRRWSGRRETEDTDRQLLERFLAERDEAAFTALLRRHGPMVFDVCRRVLHHEQDAEDAFQATFLVLARKAASVRRHRSLGGWLHEVAYRLALRAKDREMRRQKHESVARPMIPSEDLLTEASRRELRVLLDEELRRLPAKYREPLILCYLEGKTNEQAARQLGWPLGSMSRRLERGRQLLQHRLLHRGVALPTGVLAAAFGREAASAAVPPLLTANVVRMVLQTSARSIPASVSALVEEWIHEMPLHKLRLALFVTLTVVGVGAGALAFQTTSEQPTEEPPPPTEKVAEKQSRTDLYGDPLPLGALARLGTSRLRHHSAAVTFSMDGKTLISAGADGTIRYWEPATGKEMRRVSARAAGAQIHPQVFDADGKIVAGVSSEGIHVWDAGTGKELLRFPFDKTSIPEREIHFGFVRRLALSPDGKILAAQLEAQDQRNKALFVWDVDTGKPIFAPKMWLISNGFAFSSDGKLLGTVSFNEGLRLWDTATGKEVRKILGAQGDLAFSSDGKYVAAVCEYAQGGRVKVWNLVDGKEVFALKPVFGRFPVWLAFTPDNTSLVISSPAELVFYDIVAGKQTLSIPIGTMTSPAKRLAFSPDGKTAATDGTAIRLWDLATGGEIGPRAGHGNGVTSLAISRDGRSIATFAALDRAVPIWDTASGRPLVEPITYTYFARAGAFSPDGRLLVTCGSENFLRAWGSKSGELEKSFPIESLNPIPERIAAWVVAISSDGKQLVCLAAAGDAFLNYQIHVWDLATGDRLVRRAQKHAGFETRFSPDTRTMAHQTNDEVVVSDTDSGEQIMKAAGRAPLAFSPDGQILALASFRPKSPLPGKSESDDGFPDGVDAICLVELATGKKLLRIETGPVGRNLLAYSPDGRTLATANQNSFQIWDAATGKELFRRALPETYRGSIDYSFATSFAFLPGGEFRGSLGRSFATSLAFLPGGDRLATGLIDGTVLIWDLKPKTLQAGLTVRALASGDLERPWADLAGEDAAKAYQAEWTLAAAPGKTIPFLMSHLLPVAALDAKKVQHLIDGLDSPEFAQREAAEKKLASFGEQAGPVLRQALEGSPSLEVRKRLEALLTDARMAGRRLVRSSEWIRMLRAIRVLERLGDRDAVQILRKLATGDPVARPTRQAEEALQRLERRTAP